MFWVGIVTLIIVSVTPRDLLTPLGINIWDKLQHVLAYTILSGLGVMAYSGKKYLAVIFIGLVILGGVLEIIQSVIPGREASFEDAIANAVGAGIGLLFYQANWMKRPDHPL